MGLKELYTATGAKILGTKTAAKTIGAVAAASAVIAGTAAGIHAYTNGLDFTPNGEGRALHANQVHFDGSENTIGKQDDETKNGESEMYERDENAEEKEKPQTGDSASYLFDNMKQQENQNGLLDGSGTAAAIAGTVPADSAASTQPGTVLDIVKNPAAADIVLRPNDVAQVTPPTGGDTANSGTNGGQSSVTPSNPSTGGDTTPNQPSRPTTPDNNGGSGGNSSSGGENGGGSNGGATTPDNPVTPVTPTTPEKPQQTDGKPPEQSSEETGPDIPWLDGGTRFDGTVKPSDSTGVTIIERINDADSLYVGQVINEVDIIRALHAYVTVNGEIYYWTSDDLGKYLKINRISFDGGKTWITDFTDNITIPKTAYDQPMQIDMSYRFSEKESWTDYDPGNGRDYVNCSVVRHRILVLSRNLTDEDTEIPLDIVLNDAYSYNEVTQKLNLYAVQRELYNELYGWSSGTPFNQLPPITKLFPGWMEDGELVDWDYTCDGGRHVLQPSDFVDVPEGYTVRLKINKDMTWETQTLTGFDESVLTDDDYGFYGTLTVPDYIQAIALEANGDDEPGGMSYLPYTLDAMEIPASVVYIKPDSISAVLEAYHVAEDNEYYASTEEGILTNKDGTEYLAIPEYNWDLTIPENVTSVRLPEYYMGTVTFAAKSADQLPSINFEEMHGSVVVQPELLNAFITKYGLQLEGSGTTVSVDGGDAEYEVHDGYLTHDEDGAIVLDRVVTNANIYMMPAGIDKIGASAFGDGTPNLTGILLQSDDEDITFDVNAFVNRGNVDIICTSEEQMASVEKSLAGVEGASVKAADKTDEGYSYIQIEDDCILLKAPEDITEFDGTLTVGGQKIEINGIAAHAFDGCTTLEYVSLPETVKNIGVSAFENCSSLSGVMIESADTVTVMDRAFNNCTNLRFIASNAENMVLNNDYDILAGANSGTLYGQLWCLADSEGYDDNWSCYVPNSKIFEEGSRLLDDTDIAKFQVIDCNGAKVLYGCNAEDESELWGGSMGSWIALRAAGSPTEGNTIALPDTTITINDNCFAWLDCEYTVNWEDLSRLVRIYSSAFAQSGLTGVIHPMQANYFTRIENNAFYGTNVTEADFTDISLEDYGESALANCSQLTSVSFGWARQVNGKFVSVIPSASFYDCAALTDLNFTTEEPVGLLTWGPHIQFHFYDDENDRNIRIHVPEGSEEAYFEAWKPMFVGYTDKEIENDTYKAAVEDDLFWDWSGFTETEDWDRYVQAVCDYRRIHAENNLRAMFGMELLEEPENAEEHKEDYGYVDPWGGFDWGDWFDQPSDTPIDVTPDEDDDQVKIDVVIPDESDDTAEDGQTASDETISDETVSGDTETGEDTPSADAPDEQDEQDTPSADTNNTEPASEASDAAEGETT